MCVCIRGRFRRMEGLELLELDAGVKSLFEFCSLKKRKLDLSIVLVGKVQSVDNWFEKEGKINYN